MEYKQGLVSVIIPVYNVEAYLIKCLTSVMQNTYTTLEIICVDDGSTDSCGRILEQYAATDERIRVVHKPNGGVSSTRNAGLEIATGEYISFIDADDWVHPCFFDYLMRVFKAENADVVDSAFVRMYDNQELPVNVPFQYRKIDNSQLLKSGMVWRRIYRHELVKDIRFWQVQIEDTVYIMETLCTSPDLNMYKVEADLYAYRQRKDSLSVVLTPAGETEWMRIYLRRCEISNRADLIEKMVDRVRKRALCLRYEAWIMRNQTAVTQYNELLKESFQKKYPMDWKYFLFYKVPASYRSFRVLNDPSMRQYEKSLRLRGKA